MNNIDYKIFVPRGALNYIRIKEKEFLIDEILTLTIQFADEKLRYWFDINIPFEEKKYITFIEKTKFFPATLLLGNNPYEINGEIEIFSTGKNIPKQCQEITVLFRTDNLKNMFNYPRKEAMKKRSEILDLED